MKGWDSEVGSTGLLLSQWRERGGERERCEENNSERENREKDRDNRETRERETARWKDAETERESKKGSFMRTFVKEIISQQGL